MKVLIVCSGDWIERWASFIHSLSKRTNIELSLATTTSNTIGKDRIKDLSNNGVKVHILRAMPGRLFGIDAATVYGKGISNVIKQNFDVIHFIAEPSYIGVFQFIFLKNKYSPSTILTIRAAQNVYKKFPIPFKWIEKYTYKNIDLIAPLALVQKEILEKKGYCGPIEFIGNGYDDELFKPLKKRNNLNEKFCFGFVGYFEKYKGIYTLLEAVNSIKEEEIIVKMVGNGKEKEKFKDLVKHYKLEDKIHFLDLMPQKELPNFYNNIDCLILPSEPATYIAKPILQIIPGYKKQLIVEQFGRVLIEAMGMKKTVIGSNCGGIPDVIGDSGFIFEAGDHYDLANKMSKILRERNNIDKLGERAYKRATSQFQWDSIAAKYVKVWKKLKDKG